MRVRRPAGPFPSEGINIMTAVLEVPATESTEIVASVVPAVELRNALSACLLATSKDKFLPVLAAVHVAKVGDELTFRSTDRYRLVHVTVTMRHAHEGDWETLIDAADVKRIVGMLPKVENRYGTGNVLATIAPDAVTLVGAGSASFKPLDGEFPRTASIIPTTTAPTEEIGFNPNYLADLAKMPGRGKNEPSRFKFNGAGKPAIVRWGTDEVAYLYLLMPVRVAA